MATFYTSDLHIGHQSILGFTDRPWDTLDEMHKGLKERWNYSVGSDDTVYILGDAVMGDRNAGLQLLDEFNGHKILFTGNHDHCWRGGKKNWETWLPMYEAHFDQVINVLPPGLSVKRELTPGLVVDMAHFPTTGDSRDDMRYSAWRPKVDGWLLHGHVHSKTIIDPANKQFHVGVDAWDCHPVPEELIVEMIKANE